MFGRGKFQNGVLIEPTEEEAFDPKDVKALEAFRNSIWYVAFECLYPLVSVHSSSLQTKAYNRTRQPIRPRTFAYFQGG